MNKIYVLIAILLSACEAQDLQVPVTETKTEETKAEEPVTNQTTVSEEAPEPSTPSEVSADPTPTAKPKYCIPHELRTNYSVPIPFGGSALQVALVHDGYHDRLADPKCLLNRAITEGTTKYIPCAVNATEGEIYGHTWQSVDRTWVKNALDNDLIEGVTTTIETFNSGNRFNSIFSTKSGVVLVIDESQVDFQGYCQ